MTCGSEKRSAHAALKTALIVGGAIPWYAGGVRMPDHAKLIGALIAIVREVRSWFPAASEVSGGGFWWFV